MDKFYPKDIVKASSGGAAIAFRGELTVVRRDFDPMWGGQEFYECKTSETPSLTVFVPASELRLVRRVGVQLPLFGGI